MPLERGGELFERLRRVKKFPEEDAKFYCAQICLAIEYLHKQNIVYRDLKPENILLAQDGYLSLTDFGLAKILAGGDETTHTFCGTPDYMAPEVITSSKNKKKSSTGHTFAVDWWSIGVLTYEMVTGKTPFSSKFGKNNMFKSIMRQEVSFENTNS